MDFCLEYKFKDKLWVYESSASYPLKSTTFEQALQEVQRKILEIRNDGSGRLFRSFYINMRID